MIEHPSILITDDDRLFRETVRDLLAPLGCRTLLAGDGEEAVGIVRSEEVHLVLLDMHMPKLTGLETIRAVRRIRSPLPCILLSARLDDEIRREAEAEHVFSVLPKPVTGNRLMSLVETALHDTWGWR